MGAVTLHEIGKTAGTADAGNSGDFFLPKLAFLDELEVKRQD